MYLQEIESILPGQKVKIKYDCDGEFDRCGKEVEILLRYAEKNAKDNGGKHICRACQLRSKNPMYQQNAKDKLKETNMERYGVVNAMNTPENIAKRQEKFKDENFVKQRTKKSKETCLKKYGAEHAMHIDKFKEKQKASMQKNYGVDYPYQSSEIMEKMKAKNKEKYGVENVAALPEVQLKMAQTTLERYGVEHYNQLPEMKDYLREHCCEWLAESYANPWAKGIVRPEEWNQKQSETVCQQINNGTWKGGGKNSLKGHYTSKKCLKKCSLFRSSYELKFHYYLDHNDDVDYYDYEPFQIEYYDTENKMRHYTIDFIVKFKDGRMICVEIKNNYLQETYLHGGKYTAIKNLCEQNNMELEVWANEKIKSLELKLKDLIALKEVELSE